MLFFLSSPTHTQKLRKLTAAGLKFITPKVLNNRYATFLLPYPKCLTNIIASVLYRRVTTFRDEKTALATHFCDFHRRKVIKNIKSFVCFRISTQNFSISSKVFPSKAPLIKEHVIFKSHATPFPVCVSFGEKEKEVKSMPSHRRMCVFVITY